MNLLPKIYTLKEEAQSELYLLFDKNIRPLQKKRDGTIDPRASGLINNDVDAMRHSYVSGVYTMDFSESVAENLRFYDLDKNKVLSKTDFIAAIKSGQYPDYDIRRINGEETPVSKKDRFNFNNLG